ncbi:phage baseplate assembly protein [Tianweitania sp. BSSL-BM11]|uniref:Phage baseplate assembly protein n=1 Tax=Tianweitania aestuarii TaxID=2814886 RepID=A0ABS5RT61_9HYPH|nr:phage baseplate assembly protein [Tianweitania aestuarii]MBS9720169.1 phage baseplate assembly protein [Tianweitania aestuarii]
MTKRDAGLTRLLLDGKVIHEGGQQFLAGKGMAGEHFPRVHRVEPHGFTSNPVAGGIATVMQAGGQRDSVYAMGGANPSMVPQLDPGCSALYDQFGGILKFITAGAVFDIGSRTATFTMGGWTINAPNGVTINGDLQVNGDIHASGSIIDTTGNTNHHSH